MLGRRSGRIVGDSDTGCAVDGKVSEVGATVIAEGLARPSASIVTYLMTSA